MALPTLSALTELLKPITWFAPMWAFACGVVSSGGPVQGRWPVVVAGILLAGPLVCATSQAANDWFDRHGSKAVLFGRMIPGIRSLLSLPAGMSEMPLPKFLVYSAIGSALWATALAGAGYLLGENYDRVEQYVGPASKIILGLLVVAAVWWFVRRRREQAASTDA